MLLEARWQARHRGAPLRVVIPPWSSLSRAWIKLGLQGMMPRIGTERRLPPPAHRQRAKGDNDFMNIIAHARPRVYVTFPTCAHHMARKRRVYPSGMR